MASAEAIAAADVAKAAANKLYADNKLDEAIECYTTALQLLPELDGSDEDVVASLVGSKEAGLRAILLTNRAQCLLMQVCAACVHAVCLFSLCTCFARTRFSNSTRRFTCHLRARL